MLRRPNRERLLTPPTLSPYRPRPTGFLTLHREPGIALKVYGISATEEAPPADTVAVAIALAVAYLRAGRTPCWRAGVEWWGLPSYGVGSLIVHRGRTTTFAVLDWWIDENVLRHHVWAAPADPPGPFESLAPADVAICVWELAVLEHERAAWLRHVFTPDGHADLEAYLADRFEPAASPPVS